MYKHLIICNIFFISIIRGEMIPPVHTTTKAPFPTPILGKNENSTHKVLSEVGSAAHNNAVTLPGIDVALMNLEKNLNVTKGTSVVARKGVNFTKEDSIKSHEDELASDINFQQLSNITKNPGLIKNNITILNGTNIPNDVLVPNVNSTKTHKPLVLSPEALAKMDKINNVHIDEPSPSVKAHVVKPGSHPGMILPIVITILVVPMFAVVGYMALKRGQEAWKNRHYKRMDFLLDGMYND